MAESAEVDELDRFNDLVGSSSHSPSGRTRGATPTSEEDVDEGDGIKESKDARMWAVQGPNHFPCDEAVKTLKPGQYEVIHSQSSGYFFQEKLAQFDELMRLPDSASESILQNIETFWTKEQHFRSFGFLWKRGILLWGPAGSGKTSTLQLISQSIVENGGIAVYTSNPSTTAHGLAILRRIEPKRPCVVMLEDLDAMLVNHGEHDVLALLDGELQIDNVVFVATTNYPERLDKRIINRPSRFDIVRHIGMPNTPAREMYLGRKNKRLLEARIECKFCESRGFREVSVEGQTRKDQCSACSGEGSTPEIDLWVKETEGFSIAHLKELIVSVEVFEVPMDKAVKRLSVMMNRTPKSTDSDPGTGQHI